MFSFKYDRELINFWFYFPSGRDGRDGRQGPPGPQGLAGPRGDEHRYKEIL